MRRATIGSSGKKKQLEDRDSESKKVVGKSVENISEEILYPYRQH